MDLNNVSTLIKKINRLYDIINSIGEASDTEKDLLRAYVLDLYEAVTMDPEDQDEDLEVEEMLKKLKKQKKAEKKLKKQLNKAVEQLEEMAVPEEAEEEAEEEQEAMESNESDPSSEEDVTETQTEAAFEPELVELFNVDTNGVTELSDKLSLKPISDLTRAMGINERIFTINELFGGNRDEFENMMVALNGLTSFEEAKNVLMGSVAEKYNWHSDSRFKKARNFIKLVQRRYN